MGSSYCDLGQRSGGWRCHEVQRGRVPR